MLRIIVILIFFVCGHVQADGVNYGIGISMNEGFSIYVPIKYNSLHIEPLVQYFDVDSKTTTVGPNNGSSKSTALNFGVGLFLTEEVRNSTYLYYGLRVGYLSRESDSVTTFVTINDETDGYFISPTLGVHYYLIPGFSVGLEVFLRLEKSETKSTDSFSSTTQVTKKNRKDSRGEIIVRYYF